MDHHLHRLTSGDRPRAISDLTLSSRWRVLLLGPHPDDFDAVAVTLKYLTEKGGSLDVAVARTGGGVEEAYRPGASLADNADLRQREQENSARFFGLAENRLTFFDLARNPKDQPVDTPENQAVIEAILAEIAPDIVFLPHGNDTNTGHQVMYSLLRKAAERTGRPFAALLNRDPKTIDMRIDLYMPFGAEQADWKAEMLRCHDSQHRRNLRTRGHGFDERILDVNRTIARELNLPAGYAEAFEVEFFNQTTAS